MERENWTMLTEIILIRIPTTVTLRGILFLIFLLAYLVTVLGNTFIITLIFVDYRLHSPMYFFLSNFYFSELLPRLVLFPRCWQDSCQKGIEFLLVKFFKNSLNFYFFSGFIEFILFAAMSYDCYVAICTTLRYPTIMTSSLCVHLDILSWVGGFALILPSTILKAALPCCNPNEIDDFFCNSAPLLHLGCVDICAIELMDFLSSLVLLISSLPLTVVSYVYIISTILKIPSGQGEDKVFATCASHFTVVSMGYGIPIFVYVHPSQKSSLHINKILFILSSVITPLQNPFNFSLQNESMKDALKDTLSECQEFLKRMRSK